MLTCGDKINKVLIVIFHICVDLIADMGIGFVGIIDITAIWKKSRIVSGNNAIYMGEDLFSCDITTVRTQQELLYICGS